MRHPESVKASSPAGPAVAAPDGEPVSDQVSGVRPRCLEAGLGLILIGAPLVFAITRAPFTDPKLVLILAGTLAIWFARLPLDRKLGLAAGIWVAVLVVASVAGADPINSLTGTQNLDSGLILLGPCAYLLVAGASIPREVASRIPTWLIGAATAVSVVALAYRLWPDVFYAAIPRLSFVGSTMGHQVMLAGLTGTALAVAVAWKPRRAWMFPVALIVISSGVAISSKRVAWIAIAAALVIGFLRERPGRRRASIIVIAIVGTLTAWTVVDRIWDPRAPVSAAARFAVLDRDSAAERVVIAKTALRSFSDRPVLGWGPSNTWSGYLSNVDASDVDRFHRDIADAHNIVLESLVTSGIAGLVALLYLAWLVFGRIRRAPRELGWAAAAAGALIIYHLFQPMNVALTPMLFLLAGVAGSARASSAPVDSAGPNRPPTHAGQGVRLAIGCLLAAGLIASGLIATSSALEQWARTHYQTGAYRLSLRLDPGRLSSEEGLAIDRALDARADLDPDARPEAERIIQNAVAEHPWNPTVRLTAVDVYLIMNEPQVAAAWLREHLARFPGDAGGMSDAALKFARTGEVPSIVDQLGELPVSPGPQPSLPSASPQAPQPEAP